ncbi:hypothetical protein FACS1894186_6140 [Alphaproteobacteria bacterium]|nr:hypothetical protein FACS1894186_6140 [Alphaproteobacteria bacterium]
MRLRPAESGDAAFIAALHNAHAAGRPWTPAETEALLARAGLAGLVADGSGYILISLTAEEAEIVDIAVAPARVGQGIGRALLDAALAHAAPREVFLEVACDNPRAIALYESSGFARVGTRPHYYLRRGTTADALVMRRAAG